MGSLIAPYALFFCFIIDTIFLHLKTNTMKRKQKRCYSTWELHDLRIPAQLRLLCRLLDVPPRRVLQEFIDHVSMDILGHGGDERRMAMGYFIRCGYGWQRYQPEDIRQMLRELDTLRLEWPGYSLSRYDGQLLDRYQAQRRNCLNTWYGKWNGRMRRPGRWNPGQRLLVIR